MGIERKVRIVSSGRNFFPKGAFFYSTDKIAKLAKEVGYEGVEFFPTWRVCWETLRHGKLLADKSMISSFHRDWRFDRVMEAKLKAKPSWWYQVRNKEDWLFPPSSLTRAILRRLQAQDDVPVSVAWFADTKNFSPVMLELWGKSQGIGYDGLINWLKEDSKNRGVVVDTAKFTNWLKSNRLLNKKEKVFKELLPHIFEVHYRVKGAIDKRIDVKEKLTGDSTENLIWVLKNGYEGKVVVEFGWLDLKTAPFGLIKEDIDSFKKLHRQILTLVKNI